MNSTMFNEELLKNEVELQDDKQIKLLNVKRFYRFVSSKIWIILNTMDV